MAKRRDDPVVIPMPFEDALRRILKSGPAPKPTKKKPTGRKAQAVKKR